MRLDELPAIKNGDKFELELFPVYNRFMLAQLKKCSPGGLFCARQVTTLPYDKFHKVAREFEMDQTLETHVLEVYKPVNVFVASLMTTLSTMYIPLGKILSCKVH